MSIRPFAARQIPIEKEIEDVVKGQTSLHPLDYAPPAVRDAVVDDTTHTTTLLPLPSYVNHLENVSEIGKLSAQAMAIAFESGAKEIESMGAALIDRIKQTESMARDALLVVDEMKDTAARYRAEATRLFTQIEHCSLMTEEVGKLCIDLKAKITAT